MSTPILSIVIPTHARPTLLPVAVSSALECSPEDVEVIVVPNGLDESWKQSLASFIKDVRVRVAPISAANANAARNHGLSLAQGRYIRFLDDDDYLLPAASDQLKFMMSIDGEICSGRLRSVDENGKDHGLVGFANTKDFVTASASISGFTLPAGNIFLKSCLESCQWDPAIKRAQDNVWMMELATRREWRWVHFSQAVGVWFHHRMPRVSQSNALTGREEAMVMKILGLHSALVGESRIDETRSATIADTLWNYIHRGFPYHPIYWSRIARLALSIDGGSHPAVPEFQTGVLSLINPIFAEWMIIPIRRITLFIRDAKTRIFGRDHLRHL